MKNRSQLHVLLVEIMIAVLFFGLASTTILQTFATGRQQSMKAANAAAALLEAQNVADSLYAAVDDAAVLSDAGYTLEGDVWQKQLSNGVTMTVRLNETTCEKGVLHEAEICAEYLEKQLVALPADHYVSFAQVREEAAHE